MASDVRPQPLVLEPYGWAGIDGNWSTFRIDVGTPPQGFQILPSTCASEIWVPGPQDCEVHVQNCQASRGVLSPIRNSSSGFQTNISSTWQQLQPESLGSEGHYFEDDDSGLYGLDTVSLPDDRATTMSNQIVAGIATSDFWLGILGLGDIPSQFSTLNRNVLSLIQSLKAANDTPSLSYGYSAGASYRSSPGSLVIGGYDTASISSDYVQSTVIAAGRRSLPLWLRSLVVTNTLNGTMSTPIADNGERMAIDSTVAQLWLPVSICDALASALGLIFDDRTNLYLINETTHNRLVELNPELTFTISDEPANKTTNIVLPYAAFDLMNGPPLYTTTGRYFPIRRSTNELQNTLGRAFLQEAYLIVDWERKHFRVGQALHNIRDSRNIIPISPAPASTTHSSGLSTGSIIGIAVGLCLGFILVASIAFYFWWKRRRTQKTKRLTDSTLVPVREVERDTDVKEQRWSELHDESVHKTTPELHGEAMFSQLMSTPVHELMGDHAQATHGGRAELEGPDARQLVVQPLFRDSMPYQGT